MSERVINIISKKITLTALLITIAIIFGYIESLYILPIPVPGVKLGLGNIVILISLYNFDKKTTWFIMILKVIITSLLFSPFSTLIYSLAGGVFSLLFMYIAKLLKLNIISVSITGGIIHNIAQLSVASFILKNINTLYYLPILIIAGFIVSIITGIAAEIVNKRIKSIL